MTWRQPQAQVDRLRADEVGSVETDRATEDAGFSQRGDPFADAYSARPPGRLDLGDLLIVDPARFGAVPQGSEGKATQHDLQRRAAETGAGDVVECPALGLALPRLKGIEQQVGERRPEIGPIGLHHHRGTIAAEHVILAAQEERSLVQLDQRRIRISGCRGQAKRVECEGQNQNESEYGERFHDGGPGSEPRLSRHARGGNAMVVRQRLRRPSFYEAGRCHIQ